MVTSYDRLNDLHLGFTWTAKAAADISGGDILTFNSGTDNVTASGAEGPTTYAFDDIAVDAISTTAVTDVVGIALTNADSGNEITFAREGLFIVPAGSNGITGGTRVKCVGYSNSFEDIGSDTAIIVANHVIGRAWTAASAETNYALVYLDI